MQVTRADGKKIRERREAADFTVDELVAALLEREGLKRHPDTIRNAELGHTQLGFKTLNAVARIIGCSREDLLADDEAEVRS